MKRQFFKQSDIFVIQYDTVMNFFINLIPKILFLGCLFLVTESNAQKELFTEYISSSQWNSISRWNNNTDKLDTAGVITRKSQYNPVTIFQYALVNYELYQKTSDSRYLKTFMTQVEKYALNPERYIVIKDSLVGYPYHFNYGSLKSPWYSGMSQGYAISVLLRYYDITKKKEVLDLVVKIKNLMLSKVPIGTLNYSDDGFVWIEEYPDKKKKQVLNGFFISYVGLYEYCDFFPNDLKAKEILTGCYHSLRKKNLDYQRNNWLQYSATQGNCTNGYLKFQVIEMKHLFELTSDEYFNRQMQIWAVFSAGKKIRNSYNGGNLYFGKPLAYKGFQNTNSYGFDLSNRQWLHDKSVDSIRLNGERVDFSHSMFDEDTLTTYTGNNKDVIEFYFESLPNNHYIEINKQSVKKVFWKDKNKWLRVKRKSLIWTKSGMLDVSDISSREMKILIKKRSKINSQEIAIHNLGLFQKWMHVIYKKSGTVHIKENSRLNIEVKLSHCKDFHMFYRYGNTMEELNLSKWDADNYFTMEGNVVDLNQGYYEFMMVSRISGSLPTVTFGESTSQRIKDIFNSK